MEIDTTINKKIAKAKDVLDNIANPGWINNRSPKATGLRIDGIGSERFTNLIRVGKIKLRLRDVVIPDYQSRLSSNPDRTPRAQTRLEEDIEEMIGNFDKSEVPYWEMKSELVEEGFSARRRSIFTREFQRLHALWIDGRLRSIQNEVQLIVITAMITAIKPLRVQKSTN